MDSNVVLGRASENGTTEKPPIKVEDLGDGTYALHVTGSQLASMVVNQNTIIANQTTIITKLTAIETLLVGGISVNVLNGGIL